MLVNTNLLSLKGCLQPDRKEHESKTVAEMQINMPVFGCWLPTSPFHKERFQENKPQSLLDRA